MKWDYWWFRLPIGVTRTPEPDWEEQQIRAAATRDAFARLKDIQDRLVSLHIEVKSIQ